MFAIISCAAGVAYHSSSFAHAASSTDVDTLAYDDAAAESIAPAAEEMATAGFTREEDATVELLNRLERTGARGISGRLRASAVEPAQLALAGATTHLRVAEPGVTTLKDPRDGSEYSLLTLVPFAAKGGHASLNGYRLGFWPGERSARQRAAYSLPEGFIEVTLENRDTRVSENFRLRDFLTKDQANVWPKYLVLSMELVDKLELMLDELVEMGYDARHLHVMSGFRTPQYNAGGEGRASNSRHQYGDAADVYVDNDRDGQLDDLNGDGRVNLDDARIIVEAAERVERKHPSLVGGVGGYPATSAHPPFVHVDTRGVRARWGAL